MKQVTWLAKACAVALTVCMAQALHAAQIVVGQVGPLSGMEASRGRAYGVGMQLYFAAVNKAGGVGGHTFTLRQRDDGGRSEATVAETSAMLAEDKPLVLAGYFGSKNISNLVSSGLLAKEGIALVGYQTTEMREETPLLYSVRASLRDEVNKLTEHLATIGIRRVGLFYEDGLGTPALLAAVDEAAKKARMTITHKAPYEGGTMKVRVAGDALLKDQPQAIVMISNSAAAAAFIEHYRGSGGVAQLFATSGTDIEQLSKRLAEEQMQGVAIVQVMPSPYKIASRLAKEFNDLVTSKPNFEVPVSYAMIEGYVAAKVIVEAARRQGARPTREGMVTTLDAMDSFDLGGYVVSYRPNSRSGSRFVELSIISSSGKIRQ